MKQRHSTAIVTGGGKRIGAVVVEALIADGWTVIAHVHHAGDEVAEGALPVVADLSEPDCAAQIFAAAEGQPPVRLLVNSAARFADDRLGEIDPDEFAAHMEVNARAPALLMEELARRHQGGDALIINVTDAKLAAPNPDFLSYSLSKYALAGLTEIGARALALRGIRVNAVAPALMLPSGVQDEDNFARVHAHNPLRHGIGVDELVAAVRFLVDSPGITGQTLQLDSGQRFMGLPRDVQFLESK